MQGQHRNGLPQYSGWFLNANNQKPITRIGERFFRKKALYWIDALLPVWAGAYSPVLCLFLRSHTSGNRVKTELKAAKKA